MSAANLLVELFVEELPPKALKQLGDSFASSLSEQLKTQGLLNQSSVVTAYASPRRLAVHLTNVISKAADKAVQQKLMPVSVALSADGAPTPALLKKLQALGLDASVVAQLKKQPDGKAEALFLDTVVAGVSLTEGLQKAIDEALAKLPIPKVMSYQLADGWSSVNFVRPAHGLVALHGGEVVPIAVLGLKAGRRTQGHRFEASQAVIELRDADSYAQQLKDDGAVIASFSERRAEIVRQLTAAAAKLNLTPIQDEALLDEVTALVERPNVLTCQFEPEFLAVPQECLILTMKANQKYFPLLNAQGQLTQHFLVVSNITPADPSRVIDGNERVVRPRLADAKFFFDQDRKQSLESRLPKLDKVVYHNKLGMQSERIIRIKMIARSIGKALEGDELADSATKAASLAKLDLVTEMVGEFPELQGIMGSYYARSQGLPEEISMAIEDHYKPRFSGDQLPRNPIGTVVSMADKLESLIGFFDIGAKPTGDKDPFGLRRQALGLLRILLEKNLSINLDALLDQAISDYGHRPEHDNGTLEGTGAKFESLDGQSAHLHVPTARITIGRNLRPETRVELIDFLFDRLTSLLREMGFSSHEIDAVLATRPQHVADVPRRLNALRSFSTMAESAALSAANKRINNILKKNEAAQAGVAVNETLLSEAAERELFNQLQAAEADTTPLFASHNYQDALTRLAQLRAAVDAFFDGVMVMADDVAVRNNRLALLARLRGVFLQVADLSRLPG